jgi:hypothetical protein
MATFTDSERALFTEWRAITLDAHGNEVLVGLTDDETKWYLDHKRPFLTPQRDHSHESKKKYLQLHEKHELARLAVIGGEIQLRNEKPTRQ